MQKSKQLKVFKEILTYFNEWFACRVVAYEDIDLIAQKTGCMESYIKKGIALACFYLSRCLYLGKGLKKDVEKSNEYLGKVN